MKTDDTLTIPSSKEQKTSSACRLDNCKKCGWIDENIVPNFQVIQNGESVQWYGHTPIIGTHKTQITENTVSYAHTITMSLQK